MIFQVRKTRPTTSHNYSKNLKIKHSQYKLIRLPLPLPIEMHTRISVNDHQQGSCRRSSMTRRIISTHATYASSRSDRTGSIDRVLESPSTDCLGGHSSWIPSAREIFSSNLVWRVSFGHSWSGEARSRTCREFRDDMIAMTHHLCAIIEPRERSHKTMFVRQAEIKFIEQTARA